MDENQSSNSSSVSETINQWAKIFPELEGIPERAAMLVQNENQSGSPESDDDDELEESSANFPGDDSNNISGAAPGLFDALSKQESDPVLPTIFLHLDIQSTRVLGSCSQRLFALGKTSLLLKHVMRGDLDSVERMLRKEKSKNGKSASKMPNDYIPIVARAAAATDLSGRKFTQITAFQYALWAMDFEMVRLLMHPDYCSPARTQGMLRAYNGLDDIQTHGEHFSFDELLEKQKHYLDNLDGWKSNQAYDEMEHWWCKEIGGAQRMLPAWVIMMMCEEGSNVAWVRKDVNQAVKRDTEHLSWWFEKTYNSGKLGDTWAAARADMMAASSRIRPPLPMLPFIDQTISAKLSTNCIHKSAELKSQVLQTTSSPSSGVSRGLGN